MIYTFTIVLIAIIGLIVGIRKDQKAVLYVGVSAALYELFEIVLFIFSYKFNTTVRLIIASAFLIAFGVVLVVSNIKKIGIFFAVVVSIAVIFCLFFICYSNIVVKEFYGDLYEGRCDGLSGVGPMTVYYYEKSGPFTSARPTFRDDYGHSFSDFDVLLNEYPESRYWYSSKKYDADIVKWEAMYIANTPFVEEYDVGKCQRLCLDGLVIWKDAPGQKLYVCWSESDTNLADGFEKYDASSSLKIRHNVDFNKCGEYDVTVYEGDLNCSFKVNVVETKKDTPVKTEEEAIAIAKRYVYAEYQKSFYQEDGGMFKYSVTVDKGPGTWVVFWSQDVEWDGMYVCGGGGPEVVIDSENGEVLSCGIMQ